MNIPFINAIRSYLQGDGAAILPEMELLLFGLGILLIDFWIERKEKYWNAGLALAGTIFSAFTIWKLRGAVVARGNFAGFHDAVLVDPFFLFFATLFLAATALVILAFWIGIYPKPFFALIEKPVQRIVEQVNPNFYQTERAKLPPAEFHAAAAETK